MGGMTINNFGNGVATTSMVSLMQQELVKASVEYAKQYGIINQLMEELKDKKLSAIKKTYKDVSVFHRKYGECKWKFVAYKTTGSISIELSYWVKNIPTSGLSVNDKKVAETYNNYTYRYEDAIDCAERFKSFKDARNLYGSIEWCFRMDEICSSDFLEKGISYSDDKNDMFNIYIG